MTATSALAPVRSPNVVTGAGEVWLVRHAPTDWTGTRWCGRSDPPLTAEGRRLARATAARIAGELPAGPTILSSPLRRAHETALAIAAAIDRPVELVDELVEVDFGRVEGLTWGELSTRHAALAEAILAGGPVDWPDGETAHVVAARAAHVAAIVRARSLDGPLVVVTHGRLLAALRPELAGAGAVAVGVAAADTNLPVAPGGVIRVRFAGREGNE